MTRLGLDPGDHEFIPETIGMYIIPKRKLELPENPEIERRWKDFVKEKESRGLQANDGDLILARLGDCRQRGSAYDVGALFGKFKPWVTTRPAFTYSDGSRPGVLGGYDIFSIGSGSLFFIEESSQPKYMVFGSRHWREIGGEIDTPPAGFLKASDMVHSDPALCGILRESREEVMEPDYAIENGVMKSDFWRNLTACYDSSVDIKKLEKAFDLQEQDGGLVVLKRKIPKRSKYGEEGLFMYPVRGLDSYVADRTSEGRTFGGRASLLLQRYFKGI